MTSLDIVLKVALIGCGATAFMDLWLLGLHKLGVPSLKMALIGRWLGHCWQGRFFHPAISQASPIPYEQMLGVLAHYLIGIGFAGLLIGLAGLEWLARPQLNMALLTGLGTVLFPWLLMQPAMGLGLAAARTPSPLKNRIRSLCNHGVFGLGLFVTARILSWVS